MPQKPKHIMELIPKFREIVEDLERIKKYVEVESKILYTSQDARMVALDSLQMEISQTGMWITAFNSLANKCMKSQTELDETEFLKSVGSNLSIEDTEICMMNTLRLGFMTLIHFKIDNLFYNILRHLNALPKRTGYWNLTDEILSQCSFSKKGVEKDTLTAFAYLRNSLHNNGIHRKGNNLKLKIDQMEFNFIEGSRVECASWEHIVVLLKANVDILKKIIQSPKVKNIITEIKDDFAFGT